MTEKTVDGKPFGRKWQEQMSRKTLALEIARDLLAPEERDILDKYASIIGGPGNDAKGLELRIARANELYPKVRGIEEKLAKLQEQILKSGKG